MSDKSQKLHQARVEGLYDLVNSWLEADHNLGECYASLTAFWAERVAVGAISRDDLVKLLDEYTEEMRANLSAAGDR